MAEDINTPSINDGLRINLNLPEIDQEQLQTIATSFAGQQQEQMEGQPQSQVGAAIEQPTAFEEDAQQEEKPVEFGTKEWADIAASPFRGVLAAGQSVYELMDTVTGDILPDIDIRVLGKSETQAGKIIEGISQFASGFLVSGGVLGAAFKGAKFLANPVVGGAIKGAITDFSFMDANQERLANLIQSVPALQNPIAEYLASDKEEGDLEGRLKNALEGVGVGAVVDTAVHFIGAGVKAMKKAGKLKAEGVEPQKVADIIEQDMKKAEKEAPKPSEAVEEVKEATPAVEVKDSNVVATVKEGEAVTSTTLATKDEIDKAVVEVIDMKRGGGTSAEIKKITQRLMQTAKSQKDFDEYAKAVSEQISKRLDELAPNSVANAAEIVRRRTNQIMEEGGGELISREEALGRTQGVDTFGESARKVRVQSEGYGIIAQNMARELEPKIAAGGISDQEAEDFADILFRSYEWQGINKKWATASSRGLFAQRKLEGFTSEAETLAKTNLGKEIEKSQEVKAVEAFRNDFKTIMKDEPAKARKLIEQHIELIAKTDNISEIAENATKAISTNGRIMDTTLEYSINSLLSPKSCIVNTLSNAMQLMMRPFEFWAGSMYKGAEKQYMIGAYTQMWADAAQSFNYFKKSLAEGRGTFGATQMEDANNIKAISAKFWNIDSNTNPHLASIVDGLGRAVRFSGDVMQATDSAFKFLGMRSAAAGRFSYEAYQNGLTGDSASQFVANKLKQYFNERGLVNSQSAAYMAAAKEAKERGLKKFAAYDYINNRAQALFDKNRNATGSFITQEGREVTNTRDYGDNAGAFGQLGNSISAFAKQHPVFKFFVPFIKTPQQLLRYVNEHTPVTGQIGALNKIAVEEMSSADPLVRAGAFGRLHTGTMMWTMAGALAMSGKITGFGPQDPREKKALMATGWKPYSLKVGDNYVQFARLDPMASFFGIAADTMEQLKTGVEQDDSMVSIAFQSAWLPLQRNITNKTFLRGFTDIIDLLSASDEDAFQRVALNKVSTIIPATISNLAAGFGNDFSVGASTQPGDYLLRRIPGLTGLVDRNRNILGEAIDVTPTFGRNVLDPINPFTTGQNKNDKVVTEIARLKHPFGMPTKKLGGVVDLTKYNNKSGQTAYDRYSELVGQSRIGGATIRNELTKLFSSAKYKSMQDTYLDGYTSPKVAEVNKIVSKYRAKALQQLLKEFPEIGKAWGQKQAFQKSLKNKYSGLI